MLLQGATIHLVSGRRYGLIGRNGLGKTTLLKLLSRLVPAFHFSSEQFKMVSMRSGKAHVCAPPCLGSFPNVGFETVPRVGLIDDGPFSFSQGKLLSASSFYASLLDAPDGVMSLALCPQVVFTWSRREAGDL